MDGGFYEQRRFSPAGFGTVVALHAAALAALVLVKPTIFIPPKHGPIIMRHIPIAPDPPPIAPPPTPEVTHVQTPISRLDTAETIVDLPSEGPTVTGPPLPPLPFPTPTGTASSGSVGAGVPELPPLRVDAQFDPRFAADVQPAYPAAEERAQRDGTVRLRVTIGADGRVRAVERLSATSDAFWRATERHALSRWRFRPATLDGRPVESTKVLTLFFRIEA